MSKALDAHAKFYGKLGTVSLVPLLSKEDLSLYYSPGVAEPCLAIQADPTLADIYTWKRRTVAVVSDGSAVLGLGNIGGLAGLPVMEGKAILFKGFAGIDAVPICLSTQDPDKIIETVIAIAPSFGGINLEDIKAPECFYIEEELQKRCPIPVFHDDQHGTAIVMLAGLINSCKVLSKNIVDLTIVVQGAGAAAIAVIKLLRAYGVKHIICFDSVGAIYTTRTVGMNPYKQDIATLNINNFQGNLYDGLIGADCFIGLSGQKNAIERKHITSMAPNPIVFATSNPYPEIMPDEAKAGGASIVATGRSDFPNQLNNVLVFPGIFKGVLASGIPQIQDSHKIAAAEAIASMVLSPTVTSIVPDPFMPGIAQTVADAVQKIG